jgi:hypothetical protein
MAANHSESFLPAPLARGFIPTRMPRSRSAAPTNTIVVLPFKNAEPTGALVPLDSAGSTCVLFSSLAFCPCEGISCRARSQGTSGRIS